MHDQASESGQSVTAFNHARCKQLANNCRMYSAHAGNKLLQLTYNYRGLDTGSAMAMVMASGS